MTCTGIPIWVVAIMIPFTAIGIEVFIQARKKNRTHQYPEAKSTDERPLGARVMQPKPRK